MHPNDSFFKYIFKVFIRTVVVTSTILGVASVPGFLFFFFILVLVAGNSSDTAGLKTEYVTGKSSSENKILVIPIVGVIINDHSPSASDFFPTDNTYGQDIKRQLYEASFDDAIKAVVFDIDSPGGTIVGSNAVAEGVAYMEKDKKPVYAHISGLAASGAYWVAASAEKIYADFGSTIGSIGVINGEFLYYDFVTSIDGGLFGGGVTTKNGITEYIVSAGKGKDIGNPFRKPTTEELAIMQRGADNNYTAFVNFVAKKRGIPADTIRNQIGAYVYDNDTAQNYKLIDGTANREDAYGRLAEAAKLGRDYQVVRLKPRQSPIENLLQSAVSRFIKAPTAASDTLAPVKAALCIPNQSLVFYGDVKSVCGR